MNKRHQKDQDPITRLSLKETKSVNTVRNAQENALLLINKYAMGESLDSLMATHRSSSFEVSDRYILDRVLRLSKVSIDAGCCDNAFSDVSHVTFPENVREKSPNDGRGLYTHVTPLMQAVLHRNVEPAKLFIDMGADVNATLPCDVPYYRDDLPVLPKDTTVLMLALYMADH